MHRFIRPFYQSFYSIAFYQEIAFDRSGSGIGFLSILALIRSLVLSIILAASLGFILFMSSSTIDNYFSDMPVITLNSGKLSMNAPSPYAIKFPETSGTVNPTFVIDTEHYNDKQDYEIFKLLDDNKWTALATQTKIYSHGMNQGQDEYKVYNLSNNPLSSPLIINSANIKHWLKIFSITMIPLCMIFLYIGDFVIKVLAMLLYSLVALVINGILRAQLPYSTLQRLTAYAMWPALFIDLLLLLFKAHSHWYFVIIITIPYIFFAVKSAQEGEKNYPIDRVNTYS